MTTLKLQPKHEDTVIAKMLSLKSQINYHIENVAPFYSEMEKYEAKEYKEIYSENVTELNEKKQYILENEMLFNNILSLYGLTVTIFLVRFID